MTDKLPNNGLLPNMVYVGTYSMVTRMKAKGWPQDRIEKVVWRILARPKVLISSPY